MNRLSKRIAVILVMATALALFTSCRKSPSGTENFISLAREKGYDIYDVTYQYANAPQITKATVIEPSDQSFQIEFYIITDKENAKKLYMAQSDEIENFKSGNAKTSLSNGTNYAKRAVSTNGKYLMVAYIENTVLYVPPTDEKKHKKEIENFINELNY